MNGISLKPLTVDFHEPGFNAKLAQENQFGPWFTLSDKERQQLGNPMGPRNPQALNRYSYTLNNPVRYVDPSGHCLECAVAALLTGAGITVSAPIIAALAVGVGLLALAVFLSDETNRVWLSEQINNGITDVSSFVDELSGIVVAESRERYKGDKRTAGQIIGDEKQGDIKTRFPGEYKDKTPDQIYSDAKAGNRAARTAKKLLDSTEYDKGQKR